MYSPLVFRPDLRQCALEERLLPAISTFGIFIYTTSGLSLITPFPGANTSAAGSLGSGGPSGGSASAVSGVPMPTSLYITGSSGISSLKPGNITGVPSLNAAAAGAMAGGGVGFQIGSGSDTASTPSTTPVSRNVVADPTQQSAFGNLIQGPSATSGDADLPAGGTYRDTAPVPPPMPTGILSQTGSSSASTASIGTMSSAYSGPNPQLGAPTLGRAAIGRGVMSTPLPGSIGPAFPIPGSN